MPKIECHTGIEITRWMVFSTSIEKRICSLLFPISRESSYLLELYIIERDVLGYRTTDIDEVMILKIKMKEEKLVSGEKAIYYEPVTHCLFRPMASRKYHIFRVEDPHQRFSRRQYHMIR